MSAGMPFGWAVLLVAVGGALGAVARHLVSMPPVGPFRGVLSVNVAGSALLGALVAAGDRVPPWLLLTAAVGFAGALTTWSTLAVQVSELARRAPGRAAAYLLLTLVLGVGAAILAHGLVSALL